MCTRKEKATLWKPPKNDHLATLKTPRCEPETKIQRRLILPSGPWILMQSKIATAIKSSGDVFLRVLRVLPVAESSTRVSLAVCHSAVRLIMGCSSSRSDKPSAISHPKATPRTLSPSSSKVAARSVLGCTLTHPRPRSRSLPLI
jgi:hypothetical protein